MTPFEKALSFILRPDIEGTFSKDPDDDGNWTGGEKDKGELKGTKYGVSAASYPDLDIANLSVGDVTAIYRRDFWDRCRCDQFPSPIAIVLFDSAVNQGPSAAIRMLQQELGVKVDGVIGPKTISAAVSSDLKKILPFFVGARGWRYATTKNVQKNGRGWFRRLAACHQTALEPL